jgi:hypothetical protein
VTLEGSSRVCMNAFEQGFRASLDRRFDRSIAGLGQRRFRVELSRTGFRQQPHSRISDERPV